MDNSGDLYFIFQNGFISFKSNDPTNPGRDSPEKKLLEKVLELLLEKFLEKLLENASFLDLVNRD